MIEGTEGGLVKNAQIERLRALKKIIAQDWLRPDSTVDAGAVLADVEELVDILLMEREGHGGRSARQSVWEWAMSDIKPALTAEEWESVSYEYDGSTEVLGEGWGEREHGRANEAVNLLEGGLNYRPGATHGVAAYLLHGQPFGFTREDVGWMRMMLEQFVRTEGVYAEMVMNVRSIADRIEALLPPERKP
jgi:hypothetical protein